MTQLATVDVETGEIIEGDTSAQAIGILFRRAHSTHVDSVRYLVQCGERLRERKGSLSHGEWLPWLEANKDALGFGERTARKLISGAVKYPSLVAPNRTLGSDLAPADAVKINRQIWCHTNHRAQGTGENEWYTPEKHIEAARTVMGGIDVDPASSDLAQENVKAGRYFTVDDDGLQQEWDGRVWMNPPYSQPAIQQFIEKLVAEYSAGRTTAAIALTHNYTDTEWFHIAAKACTAICFTRGRIKFVNPEGEEASPTQGQAFFYFGKDPEKFIEEFSVFGFVVVAP